jgi:hypothetical protein
MFEQLAQTVPAHQAGSAKEQGGLLIFDDLQGSLLIPVR